jgi:hypothetical protein
MLVSDVLYLVQNVLGGSRPVLAFQEVMPVFVPKKYLQVEIWHYRFLILKLNARLGADQYGSGMFPAQAEQNAFHLTLECSASGFSWQFPCRYLLGAACNIAD